MKLSTKVFNILNNYKSDNPGVRANLARILMHGKLGGTGKLIILPVDQGWEHGPARSLHDANKGVVDTQEYDHQDLHAIPEQ